MREIDPAHPEYQAFRDAMKAMVARTPEVVRERRAEIARCAAPFHAFDVICAAWMSTGVARPDSLDSYRPGAPTITAEYVAHVLLERKDPAPVREPTPADYQAGIPMRSITDAVEAVGRLLPAYFAYRQANGRDTRDPYLALRVSMYAHRLYIRSFAYEWQERDTLLGLFAPFDSELRERCGFTAADAVELTRSLGALQFDRTAELGAAAREGVGHLRKRYERRRAGDERDGDSEFIRQLAKLPVKDAERWLDRSGLVFMLAHIGRHAAFTAEELARASGRETEVAQRFLDAFSVHFGGDVDGHGEHRNGPRVGGEIEVIRRRPIVHHDGRYLPAAVDSVFYGLRDVLTDGLRNTAAWKRFNTHRAREIERRASAALTGALEVDWHHVGVKYWYRDDAAVLQEGEADGVLRADTIAVLVETKAGSLSPSARRAAPERLERGLRDLIVGAHEQLDRSARVLVGGRAERVTDANGRSLELDFDGITRVVRIAVSLEDLSAVAPAVWRLGDIGLLPRESRAPWTVGIHELELICSLTEHPAQLLHYILRRLRTYRQRIWGMDEMDFWIRYLEGRLWWEDEQTHGVGVELGSHTDALDAWAYGERGLRRKAKRPKAKLDRPTRLLLDAIAATRATGRWEAQLMLLEMDSEASQQVARELRRSVERARRDGQLHRSTFVFGDDMGVTVEGLPYRSGREHLDALADRGSAALEEHGLRRWLGLSATLGSKRALTGMVLLVVLSGSQASRATSGRP